MEMIALTRKDIAEMTGVVRDFQPLVGNLLRQLQVQAQEIEESRAFQQAVEHNKDPRELLAARCELLEAHLRRQGMPLEGLHEQARLLERVRHLEGQETQMQKDLETLIFRIEELELDNERLTVRLNTAAPEAARRAEQETLRSVVEDLALVFDVPLPARDLPSQQALREVMGQVRTKLKGLRDKIEALEEGKELQMRDRLQLKEQVRELTH